MRSNPANIFLTSILLTACTPSQDKAHEPAMMEAVPQEVYEQEWRAQLERIREYERQLARAPSHYSDIRDYLIANPDRFPADYEISVRGFRDQPNALACTHPADAIEMAQADGWQLVECVQTKAIFLRELATPRLGRKDRPRITDYYEVLTLSFDALPQPESPEYELDRWRILSWNVFGEDTTVVAATEVLGTELPDDLLVRKFDTQDTWSFHLIDRDGGSSIHLHAKRPEAQMSRNATGKLVVGSDLVRLESPITDYSEMHSALMAAARYFAADR